MEFLEQQAFEHQHKESTAGNLDRGCFEKKILEDSIDQNLDMILVEMKSEVFYLEVSKWSIHQCYNPNQNDLDSVYRYNQVVAVTSHKIVSDNL